MQDVEASGSEGGGQEGPARLYPNGHPLDWRTNDGHTLLMEDEVLRLVNERRSALSHRRAGRGHSRHMRVDVHNSEGHRKNIDTPLARRTGVGFQSGGGGADWPTYWTQVFSD